MKHANDAGPAFWIMALHVFTLFAFVVARPIFTLLTDHPGYLIAINMGELDLYVATTLILTIIPLVLVGLVATAGLFGHKFRLLAQSFVCAGFVSVFTLHLVGEIKAIPFMGSLKLPAIIFVVFVILYYKKPRFSLVITALSPVIILFPVLFLLNGNIERVLQADETLVENRVEISNAPPGNKPPITMVLFDELPLVDLLDAEGAIDAKRYPNFAALAEQATWYKNATTVSNATQIAVPAILSGKRPQTRKLPVFSEYPNNIFSLLEGYYTFHVIEPITRLYRLPPTDESQKSRVVLDTHRIGGFLLDMSIVYMHIVLPRYLTALVPAINDQWGGFFPASLVAGNQKNRAHKAMAGSRAQSLQTFISDIGTYPRETIHFIHVMLPHRPLLHLPSGRIHTKEKYIRGTSVTKEKLWQGEQLLIDKMHQRHRLQIAYVDTLLGQLISTMKAADIYQDGLLIVVADHGISYQQGLPTRYPMKENFAEIAFVPMFIKYPSQVQAKEVDSNAETIDILPTIVDVLDTKVSWKFDGTSLLDESARQEHKTLLVKSKDLLIYQREEYLAAKQKAIERNISRFSLDNPRSDLFHFEPGLDLVGTKIDDLVKERIPCSIYSKMIEDLGRINLLNNFLPTEINGAVNCPDSDFEQMLVVVGVNGVISAVTKPYLYEEEVLFSVILSDEVFKDGTNEIELFTISF